MKITKARLKQIIKEELEAGYVDLVDLIDDVESKLNAMLKHQGLKDLRGFSYSPDDYGDSPAGIAKRRFLTTGPELANSLRKGPEIAALIEKLIEQLRGEISSDDEAGYGPGGEMGFAYDDTFDTY
jgi:hypothetical protein